MLETENLHKLKNHISVIYSFTDLLLGELAPNDPRAQTVGEIQRLARTALELLRSTKAPE